MIARRKNLFPAEPTTQSAPPTSPMRVGVIPATFTLAVAVLLVGLAGIQLLSKITTTFNEGYFRGVIACSVSMFLVCCAAAMLIFGAREWLKNNIASALLFTFVAPTCFLFLALLCLANSL